RNAMSRLRVKNTRMSAPTKKGAIPAIQRMASDAVFTPASTPTATVSNHDRVRASTTRYADRTAAVNGVDVWKFTMTRLERAAGPTTVVHAAAKIPAARPATRAVAHPTKPAVPTTKT